MLHLQRRQFALQHQGIAGDKPWDKFRENLRKAIAAGLPPEAALRALTTDAARILGVREATGHHCAGQGRPPRRHGRRLPGCRHAGALRLRRRRSLRVRGEAKKPTRRNRKPRNRTPSPNEPADKAEAAKAPEQATEIEADRNPKAHTGGNVLHPQRNRADRDRRHQAKTPTSWCARARSPQSART